MSRAAWTWHRLFTGACCPLLVSAISIGCSGATTQPIASSPSSGQVQPSGSWSLFEAHAADRQLGLWNGSQSGSIAVSPSASFSGDAASIDAVNDLFRQGYQVRIGTAPAFQYGESVTATAVSVQRGDKVPARGFSGIVIGAPAVISGRPRFAVDHALVIYLPEWTTIRSDSQFSTIDAIIAGTQDDVNNHICVAGQGYDVTVKGLQTITVGVWVFRRADVSDSEAWARCQAK